MYMLVDVGLNGDLQVYVVCKTSDLKDTVFSL